MKSWKFTNAEGVLCETYYDSMTDEFIVWDIEKMHKAMFVNTDEVFEYYHSTIDGMPTTIIKRGLGFTRYYTEDVIAQGVSEGWLKLVEDNDEQA